MAFQIYTRSGQPRMVLHEEDNSSAQVGVQDDDVLNLSCISYECVRLEPGDYTEFLGIRYWAIEAYTPKQASTVEWNYDVKLYGPQSIIKLALLLNSENVPVEAYTAPAREHLSLVVRNLNRWMGTTDWKVGACDSTDTLSIDYSGGTYANEALDKLTGKTGLEWWMEGMTVNLSRCEQGDYLDLGYGEGLLTLERDNADNVKFFTRLFPVGSTRNIDPEKYGHSRLQLPSGQTYVERNTEEFGVIEHYESEAFDGIFPRRTGHVSSVRTDTAKNDDGSEYTIYYFKDDSLDFDPNEYEIGGLVKRVIFQDGDLAGLGDSDKNGFEVNFNSHTGEFEIITIWPYSDDTQLPGGLLVPKKDDAYILINIRMPDTYYPAAEKEYAQAVDTFLQEHSGMTDRSVYKCHTDYIDLDGRAVTLSIGQHVRLHSDRYFPKTGYRESRITRITRNAARPNDADIEISDVLSKTSQSAMQDSLTAVRNEIKDAAGSFPDIIRSWENTPASDSTVFSSRKVENDFLSSKKEDVARAYINFLRGLGLGGKLLNDILRVGDKDTEPGNQSVYSSLRTDKEIEKALAEISEKYLRKDIEDTARELIRFLKGIDVKGAGVFHDTLNSPDFLSGFKDGKGWAILLRKVLNVAGVEETKSYGEFDELTIRGTLRVFEFIINQLKGEADNYVFSGMMKVERVDTAAKKIWLDTGGGLLYNPFRGNDILDCQRYGGRPAEGNDYNVIKQYSLVVKDAGMGDDADGGQRLDWITYDNFTGKETDIAKGDVLVRMDNLTDKDRKGIIMNTTIGMGAPYMDVLYGAKTDPDGAVRSRFGNLEGVYNYWFGWLKNFGAFVQNLYAIGEFHFRNGENIQTRLDMMENLFRVDMQNKTYNMSEADNFLKNASFTENMDGWERENKIRAWTAGGKLLMFNRNLFTEKEKVAGIVNLDGRNLLRIKNSGIRQANADIRKPDPATSVLYLTFKYICKSAGTLTAGFEGAVQAEGSLPFVTEEIAESTETVSLEYSGTWDGTGDFVLRFTGDIYIDVLALTNRPLDDFKIEVSTKFEQTAEKIALLGRRIDHTDQTVADLGVELDAAEESIRLWGEKTDKINETVTQMGIDLDMAEQKLELYAGKTDEINDTVTKLGVRMDAAESRLELFAEFEEKAEGTLDSLGIRLDAAESTLETYGTHIDNLSGEVTGLGNRMNAAEGRLDTYVNKTNEITGDLVSLGSRMDAAEKKFTNYVLTDTFNGEIGEIETTLSRHWSAIEQTEESFLLSINKSTGYPLYKDTRFRNGLNGLNVYNNAGGDAVQIVREGEGSVRITKAAGNSEPGLGGFTWHTPSRANAVFEARFTAKIPQGYSVNFNTNATGNGSKNYWLTDRKGTGDWKEYRFQLYCGSEGEFSTTCYFYLTKEGSSDTANTAVTWYLQAATVYDLSGYEDPISYINLTDNLAKIKANRIELEGAVTANEFFKILEDGSAEMVNCRFSGSIFQPFRLYDPTIYIEVAPDGSASTAERRNPGDNFVVNGWSGDWQADVSLSWNTGQNGRLVRMNNYRWGNSYYTGGVTINAPSGKYFYEDGLLKSKLTFDREVVELLGYGDENTFYGWIVLNRVNIGTSSRYGSCAKVMYEGVVQANGSLSRFKSFDGGKITVSKQATGRYIISLPASLGTDNYTVLVTGIGAFASVGDLGTSSFKVFTGYDFETDGIYDSNENYKKFLTEARDKDAGFTFQVISTADWS